MFIEIFFLVNTHNIGKTWSTHTHTHTHTHSHDNKSQVQENTFNMAQDSKSRISWGTNRKHTKYNIYI